MSLIDDSNKRLFLAKTRTAKPPTSNLQVEMILKSGGLEIRTKGSISELAEEISSISEFAKWAASKLARAEEAAGPSGPEEPSGLGPPVIKASKNTSDNIRALFATPWGKVPKGMEEVTKALEVNAVPASPSLIGMSLIGLVKKGELRRVKKEGKWIYYRTPS